jgi:hypothetical protein
MPMSSYVKAETGSNQGPCQSFRSGNLPLALAHARAVAFVLPRFFLLTKQRQRHGQSKSRSESKMKEAAAEEDPTSVRVTTYCVSDKYPYLFSPQLAVSTCVILTHE